MDINTVKNFLELLLLFTIIESFIFSLFINKIGKMRMFKWYEILGYAIILVICSLIFPPLIRQIFMILIPIIYMYFNKFGNLKHIIVVTLLEFGYILVIEMLFGMLMDLFCMFNWVLISNFIKFIYMLPIRFVEVLLIMIGGKLNGSTVDERNRRTRN